jgi:hypothetical protein
MVTASASPATQSNSGGSSISSTTTSSKQQQQQEELPSLLQLVSLYGARLTTAAQMVWAQVSWQVALKPIWILQGQIQQSIKAGTHRPMLCVSVAWCHDTGTKTNFFANQLHCLQASTGCLMAPAA